MIQHYAVSFFSNHLQWHLPVKHILENADIFHPTICFAFLVQWIKFPRSLAMFLPNSLIWALCRDISLDDLTPFWTIVSDVTIPRPFEKDLHWWILTKRSCRYVEQTEVTISIISKNNSLHSERPVHQTHRTLECKSRIRTQPWYHTTHQTQRNAASKTQDTLDAVPNTQGATGHWTTSSYDNRRVPPLPFSDLDHLGHNKFHTVTLLNLLLVVFYYSNIQAANSQRNTQS